MRVLLDTNVFVHLTSNPDAVSVELRMAVDCADERYLSVASPWEMAIKAGLGKLRLEAPVVEFVRDWMARLKVRLLPIDLAHVATLEALPPHHRDPFDRLIVAQALSENLAVATTDRRLYVYGIDRAATTT